MLHMKHLRTSQRLQLTFELTDAFEVDLVVIHGDAFLRLVREETGVHEHFVGDLGASL